MDSTFTVISTCTVLATMVSGCSPSSSRPEGCIIDWDFDSKPVSDTGSIPANTTIDLMAANRQQVRIENLSGYDLDKGLLQWLIDITIGEVGQVTSEKVSIVFYPQARVVHDSKSPNGIRGGDESEQTANYATSSRSVDGGLYAIGIATGWMGTEGGKFEGTKMDLGAFPNYVAAALLGHELSHLGQRVSEGETETDPVSYNVSEECAQQVDRALYAYLLKAMRGIVYGTHGRVSQINFDNLKPITASLIESLRQTTDPIFREKILLALSWTQRFIHLQGTMVHLALYDINRRRIESGFAPLPPEVLIRALADGSTPDELVNGILL